jgi:hypothetical protein
MTQLNATQQAIAWSASFMANPPMRHAKRKRQSCSEFDPTKAASGARQGWLWTGGIAQRAASSDPEHWSILEDRAIQSRLNRIDDEARAARNRPARARCQATRIAIPHHTTATAIAMQATVRAFSKADEAIAMLSFAYPEQMLIDSISGVQLC